jgi:hypothetical protein
MKFLPDGMVSWKIASKTRPIKAKPLISLLVDRSITSRFLIDTLEGKEPLGDGVVICIGEAGDAWQQMPKKLLAKYNVTSIDNDGWMICDPKPDNAVNAFEVTEYNVKDPTIFALPETSDVYKVCDFYVRGQWGGGRLPQWVRTFNMDPLEILFVKIGKIPLIYGLFADDCFLTHTS